LLPLANALAITASSWPVARNSIPAYIAMSTFLLLYFGHLIMSTIARRRRHSETPDMSEKRSAGLQSR
jgi:hypothetical protein